LTLITLNLEKLVGSTHMAQTLNSSSYMKKLLIINKVTSHFFITLSKSISCTLHALPTNLSRLTKNTGAGRDAKESDTPYVMDDTLAQ
jgi:hypothetical protein